MRKPIIRVIKGIFKYTSKSPKVHTDIAKEFNVRPSDVTEALEIIKEIQHNPEIKVIGMDDKMVKWMINEKNKRWLGL